MASLIERLEANARLVERGYGSLYSLADSLGDLINVQVLLQEIRPGESTSLHEHESEEIFLALQGSAVLERGTTRNLLNWGSTLGVSRGVPHRLVNCFESTYRGLIIISPPNKPQPAPGQRQGAPGHR
jgi:quercetin dioxygenase-like cupin family protein